MKKFICQAPPTPSLLKFNVDEAANGKPGPMGVKGVLRNTNGIVIALFSKHMGCM